MESEVKTESNIKSLAYDPIIRVVKYELDQNSPELASKLQPTFQIQDVLGASSLANEAQQSMASMKVKLEGNLDYNQENLDKEHSDSGFNAFCQGLHLSGSPSGRKNMSPLDSSRNSALRGSKNGSTTSYKAAKGLKETNSTSPMGKKFIAKLKLNDGLTFIKSNRDKINIEVASFPSKAEERTPSPANKFFDPSLGCNEEFLEKTASNTRSNQFSFNNKLNSPLSGNIFQEKDLNLACNLNEYLDSIGPTMQLDSAKIEKIQDDDIIMVPNNPYNPDQRFTLESLNSFSGKKSHVERNRTKKFNSLGVDNNSGQSLAVRKHVHEGENTNGDPTKSKKKVTCNCRKSKCLKLYCDCFAAGEYCGKDCNCEGCFNNEENEAERLAAIESTLERNPSAFKPKVEAISSPAKVLVGEATLPKHVKGCNCKKSGCLKKYCECFQAGIKCTDLCKCEGCKNINPSALLKKAQSMGGQDGFSLYGENSQSSFCDPMLMHVHSSRFKRGYNLKDLEEELFQGEGSLYDEDDEEYGQPQKKMAVENFNAFQSSSLLDEIISPPKTKSWADTVTDLKVKREDINVKKEDSSTKGDRRRKKTQNRAFRVLDFDKSPTTTEDNSNGKRKREPKTRKNEN